MPPKKKERPAPADVAMFTHSVSSSLTAFEKERTARDGRAMQRRLNRYEYENALRDLLNVPWVQMKDRLPQDGEAYRFNKSGEALDVSLVQMARYMSAADYAMRQAMRRHSNGPPTTGASLRPRRDRTSAICRARTARCPTGSSFPVLDSHAQPDVRAGRAPNTSPETREREAVGKVSSIFSDAGGYSWGIRAPVAGRYRHPLQRLFDLGQRRRNRPLVLRGPGRGEGAGLLAAGLAPAQRWMKSGPAAATNRSASMRRAPGQTRPVGEIDFTPEPTVGEIEVNSQAARVIQTDAMRLFRTRVNGTDEQYVNPLATNDGMPGYAVQWMEVEGPLDDAARRAAIRCCSATCRCGGSAPAKKAACCWKSWRRAVRPVGGAPAGGALAAVGRADSSAAPSGDVAVEVVSENPQQDAERLLRSFMQRAYRRPVEEAHVQRFLALFKRAVRARLRLRAVDARRLHRRARLAGIRLRRGKAGQARRLRAGHAPGAFPLELRAGRRAARPCRHAASCTGPRCCAPRPSGCSTTRSRAASSKRSPITGSTCARSTTPRRPRRSTTTTNWTIRSSSPRWRRRGCFSPNCCARICRRATSWIRISRSSTSASRITTACRAWRREDARVKLPPDSVRGGLMTQASVLKVTANGTTTSPVLRGNWITERILGIRSRPPPPVPAVEPDIRGAVTHPPAAREAPRQSELRVVPQQDGSAGLRAGKLRRDGRLARPLPRGRREREARARHRHERPGIRLSLRAARGLRRRVARWPRVQRHREFKRLLLQRRSARGPQSREAVGRLRDGRAGALLRPRANSNRSCSARARASTACAASCMRSSRANCSKTNDTRHEPSSHPTALRSSPRASAISRRRFLRGAGIALSLPFLDSMLPPFARARDRHRRWRPNATPRRMFGICNNLGLLPEHFFPTGTGRDYTPSPYLKLLQEHRNDFTVFSGVSHPNVDGGHPSDISFLTAAPHPASSSFRNTISLDQHIAERIGTLTRFPSLTLAVNGAAAASRGRAPAWPFRRRKGRPSVFKQLFLQGTPEQVEAQIQRTRHGPQHPRRRRGPGEGTAAQRRRARPQPARSIFHQRARPRAPPAGVARLGAQAQAGRQASPRRSIPPARRNTWTR